MVRCTLLRFLSIQLVMYTNVGHGLKDLVLNENSVIEGSGYMLESDKTEERITILEKKMEDLFAENMYLRY